MKTKRLNIEIEQFDNIDMPNGEWIVFENNKIALRFEDWSPFIISKEVKGQYKEGPEEDVFIVYAIDEGEYGYGYYPQVFRQTQQLAKEFVFYYIREYFTEKINAAERKIQKLNSMNVVDVLKKDRMEGDEVDE